MLISQNLKFILVCFAFLMITGCETEINRYEQENTNEKLEIPIMHYRTLKEVLSESDPLRKSLSKIVASQQKNSHNGFSIDTNKVLEKQFSAFTEYVFIVNRPENLSVRVENYVQRVYPNDSISQYLTEYPIVEQNDSVFLDFDNIKVTFIDEPSMVFAKVAGGCEPELVQTEVCTIIPCTGTNGNGEPVNHIFPGDCECTDSPNSCSSPYLDCNTVLAVVDNCDGGSSTTNPPETDPITPTTGGNATGISNGDGNELNTGLTPNVGDKLLPKAVLDFIETLPQNQKDWLESLACNTIVITGNSSCNQQLHDNIVEFLSANIENAQVTTEAQAFFDAAVEELQNNPDAEVDWEDRIIRDSSFTGSKADCMYNDLKSSNQDFADRINKFEGDFPVSHLKFIADDIGTAKGRTIAPNNTPGTPNSPDYVITIIINNNSSSSGMDQRPNLLLAKTIIHEVIHAEMFRKIMSLLNNGSFSGVTLQQMEQALSNGDFPGIYEFFRQSQDWQHSQMASFYINTIAAILQEYDTGLEVQDESEIQSLYKSLAWEGLRYSSVPAWANNPNQSQINSDITNYVQNHQNETCP